MPASTRSPAALPAHRAARRRSRSAGAEPARAGARPPRRLRLRRGDPLRLPDAARRRWRPASAGPEWRVATASCTNPLSERYSVLRRSLLPNLVESARFNQRRGADAVRLFEIGGAFFRAGEPGRLPDHGRGEPSPWSAAARRHALGRRAGAATSSTSRGWSRASPTSSGARSRARPAELPGLLAGSAAELVTADGAVAGFLGRVEPGAVEEEPDSRCRSSPPSWSPPAWRRRLAEDRRPIDIPSRFPSVAADLTLTHPLPVPWAEIAAAIERGSAADLVAFGLKDRYTGEGVPEGAVNTTLSVPLRLARAVADPGRGQRRPAGARRPSPGALLAARLGRGAMSKDAAPPPARRSGSTSSKRGSEAAASRRRALAAENERAASPVLAELESRRQTAAPPSRPRAARAADPSAAEWRRRARRDPPPGREARPPARRSPRRAELTLLRCAIVRQVPGSMILRAGDRCTRIHAWTEIRAAATEVEIFGGVYHVHGRNDSGTSRSWRRSSTARCARSPSTSAPSTRRRSPSWRRSTWRTSCIECRERQDGERVEIRERVSALAGELASALEG